MKYNIVTNKDLKSTYKSEKYSQLGIKKASHILPLKSSINLAKIFGCLITDGFMDIRPRYKSIYYGYIGFFSKDVRELIKFGELFKDVFSIEGKIREWGRDRYGYSKGYIIINSVITRILYKVGVPGGEKVNQIYRLPKWLLNSNFNIKNAFLRQIFDCEGSIGYCKNTKRWEIKYSMYKAQDLSNNLISFLNDIMEMLSIFQISSIIGKKEKYTRKRDRKKVVGYYIKIYKKNDVYNFYKNIGFGIEYKQLRLRQAVKSIKI